MRITRYYCVLLAITTLVIYRLIIINGYEHDGDSAKTAPCGRLRLPGDDLSIVSGRTSGQALKEPACVPITSAGQTFHALRCIGLASCRVPGDRWVIWHTTATGGRVSRQGRRCGGQTSLLGQTQHRGHFTYMHMPFISSQCIVSRQNSLTPTIDEIHNPRVRASAAASVCQSGMGEES